MAQIVPIEKRSKVEARKQGLHYGAYLEKHDKPKKSSNMSKQRKSNLIAGQNEFNLDFNSTAYKMMSKGRLTKEEKDVIKETEEEYKLKGHFRRVFPNGNY